MATPIADDDDDDDDGDDDDESKAQKNRNLFQCGTHRRTIGSGDGGGCGVVNVMKLTALSQERQKFTLQRGRHSLDDPDVICCTTNS